MHINVNQFDNNARVVHGAYGREMVTIMVLVILNNNAANHIYHHPIVSWKHIRMCNLNIVEATSNQTTSTDPLIYNRQITLSQEDQLLLLQYDII